MEPAPGNNDKGFWEDVDFNRMNERILAKAASRWHFLHPIDAEIFERSEYAAERIEAATLLDQKLKKASVFAVKDPRTAVLLPFWQCVINDLGVEPSYLITLRNPLETAESLRKRDGFDHQKSLVLWLKHTYAAIKETEGAGRLFVSYDKLIANPRRELERIAEGLGLTMPSEDSPAFKDYVSDFLDGSLHHNRISANELWRDNAIPAPIPALYDLVSDWSEFAPDEPTVLPEKLDKEIKAYFDNRGDFLEYSDRIETTLAAVHKRAQDEAAQVKKLQAQLTEVSAQSDRKTGEFEARLKQQNDELATAKKAGEELLSQLEHARSNEQRIEERVRSLQAKLRDASANVERLSNERQVMFGEISEAKMLIGQLKGNLASHATELKHSANKIERMSASADANAVVTRELRKELRLQRASLLELRNSTSWRLTRPVRIVKSLIVRSGTVVRGTGGAGKDN